MQSLRHRRTGSVVVASEVRQSELHTSRKRRNGRDDVLDMGYGTHQWRKIANSKARTVVAPTATTLRKDGGLSCSDGGPACRICVRKGGNDPLRRRGDGTHDAKTAHRLDV